LPSQEVEAVVEVLDRYYSIEDFSLEYIPDELWNWQIGGLTDPIGQLFSWLWDQVSSAFNIVREAILGALNTVRDYLWDLIKKAFDSLGSLVSNIISFLSSLKDYIATIAPAIAAFLRPVTDALGSVGTAIIAIGGVLSRVWDVLRGLGDSIIRGVTGAFGVLRDWLTSAIAGISKAIEGIPRAISGIVQGISDSIGGFVKTIQGGLATLSTFFSDLLSKAAGALSSAITGLGSFLNQIWQGLSGVLSGVYNAIVGGLKWVWDGLLGVRDWLYSGIKTIAVSLTQVWDALTSMLSNIPGFFSSLWTSIQAGLTTVGQTLSNAWDIIKSYFSEKLSEISTGVGEAKVALMGFINPLIDIGKNFTTFVTAVGDFFKDPLKPFKEIGTWIQDNVFDPIYKWGSETLIPTVIGGLSTVGNVVIDAGKTLWSWIEGALKGLWGTLSGGFLGLLKWGQEAVKPKSPSILDDINSFLADMLFAPISKIPTAFFSDIEKMRKEGIVKPDMALVGIGRYLLSAVSSPYIVSALLRWAGDQLNVTVDLHPFGVGAAVPIKIGMLIKHMARVVWKIPDIMLSSLGYGLGMWIMQPITRVINSMMRNTVPVEMPTLEEVRTMTNRASVSEKFADIVSDLTIFLEYYGYSDWTINWNLGLPKEELAYLKTTVKDRFGKERTIPLYLRAQVPSGSELAAMMVRDIFFDFDSFQKAMLVQGIGPDVSKFYYLMRYRYPTMEALWTFITRIAGGFGWITQDAKPEADLGFAGISPKAMSDAYSKEPIKAISTLAEKLLPYAKWHDYAPFAWQQDFTSDRLIMIDLMADIPTRIDARWMYKWGIIDEDPLLRIGVARGMHPDWVEKISVAEAMNALTEERTMARTGPLNVYEAGFLSATTLENTLGSLAKITLFKKDYVVKFLEGERKLLMLRSLYDRAQNALRQLWGGVTMSFTRSMRSKEEATTLLVNYVGSIKAALKLDIELDKTFLDVWLSTYEIRREVDTIQRVRYWSRTFIYRASQLAEAGEDVKSLIDEFATSARLTDIELKIMQTFAGAFIEVSKRNKAIGAAKSVVKAKMRRGEITEAEALAELKKAGMSENDSKAFVEGEIKFRTVSTDKLVSMAEYIPIDKKKLKDKMDAEGVPEDEQKMYMAYIVAAELAEEMGKVVTELVTDCSAGKISVDDFSKALDQLATLNGSVKEAIGVDWIVLSPDERDLYVALAKLRRARAGK